MIGGGRRGNGVILIGGLVVGGAMPRLKIRKNKINYIYIFC